MFLKPFYQLSLRNTASQSLVLSRNFAFKSDLKIKWVRPEKIPCYKAEKSGDLDTYSAPDQSKFLFCYDHSQELKNADDIVKNMFTLEQNRRKESVDTVKRDLVNSVRRHNLDVSFDFIIE